MTEPKTLTIELYNSSKKVELPLAEAVDWLTKMLNSVPAECRDSAWFDVSLDYGVYDDPTTLDFQVYYNRLETDEETANREAEEARRKEESKRCEIARLKSNLERLERETR